MMLCLEIIVPRKGSWILEAMAAYATAQQRANEKVMALSHEPTDHLMTAQEAAEFYEVPIGAILRCCAKHHREIIEEATAECMAHVIHCGTVPPDVEPVLIPKRTVLDLSKNLRNSLVAETVQSALLDAFMQSELTGVTARIG